MRVIGVCLVIFSSLALAGAERQFVRSGQIELGALKEGEWHPDCSCAFYDAKAKKSMLAFWAVEEPAVMFVNGSLKNLKVTTPEDRGPEKLGTLFSAELEASGISATITAKTTFVCPKSQESCEVTGYKGRLVVRSSGKVGSFPVTGECGC